MADIINVGAYVGDPTADSPREGGIAANAEFAALAARLGVLEVASGAYFFACILRNSGGGWTVIDDTNHAPYNIQSVTNDSEKIIVTPSITWSKIRTVLAVQDETFASGGLIPGVRVTTTTAEIFLSQHRLNTGYVYYDGADWQYDGDDITSVVWDTDKVIITHGSMGYWGANVMGAQISPREDGYDARIGHITTNTTEVKFYSGGVLQTTESASMKFHYLRTAEAKVLNPNSVVTPLGNIWVLGYCQ